MASSVHVVQVDDPPRAISVQNPMSINDLMVNADQPARRLSVGAAPPPRSAMPMRRARPNRRREQRGSLPPMPGAGTPSPDMGGGGGQTDPEEMGYDLILNERKKKKPAEDPVSYHHVDDEDDVFGGGAGISDPFDDDAPMDDYIDPRERREYERNYAGMPDAGPELPPAGAPRRLSTAQPRGGDRYGSPAGYDDAPPDSGYGYGRSTTGMPGSASDFYSSGGSGVGGDGMSYQERMEKKQKYLEGLDKFRRKGMDVGNYDMNSSYEEIESEYNRHKRAVDVEASIQFSRKMLMACVTGLEYLNKRFDPLGLKLDGWSESVIEDIHNYDDVFERLYDKYHTSAQMAPEFELLLMVAGSAFMYHLTNSMFRSAMPGMAQPEAMKNVRRGVMGAMRGAFNGAANGGGMSGGLGGMFNAANSMGNGPIGRGGGPGGAAVPPPRRSGGGARAPPPSGRANSSGGRREMRGPSTNMDDLLNNLMDREPGEVTDRVLDDIDDILNNPSDDDAGDATVRITTRPMAGPGGVPGMSGPAVEI